MFVPPTWLEGLIIQAVLYLLIPMVVGVTLGVIAWKSEQDFGAFLVVCGMVLAIGVIIMTPIASVFWHYEYEVPSVQEKIVTVKEWQPKPNVHTNDNGMMVIDNADELLMITTNGEGFLNEENFLFQKWNTRDILNQLKVNGTYKIKYYGWRNGYNSGFPNILSVEQVVNESNAHEVKFGDYFGTKLA